MSSEARTTDVGDPSTHASLLPGHTLHVVATLHAPPHSVAFFVLPLTARTLTSDSLSLDRANTSTAHTVDPVLGSTLEPESTR